MKQTLRLAALFLTFLAASCATAPIGVEGEHTISGDKISRITVGVTTREQLQELFGEPLMKIPGDDGMTYFYKDANLASLRVVYGYDQVVAEFDWHE